MVWAACRGGGDASAGSGWRREGEREPLLVGRLGRLVTQQVGPKATRPKGRTVQRGGWGDWAGTEEKFFSK
jgi:hypothetical protein